MVGQLTVVPIMRAPSAAVIQALRKQELDGSSLQAVDRLIPSDALGVLLYGSRARGDHVTTSDVDVLVLVPSPRKSVRSGAVSVTYYTESQVRSASQTLYGTHLLRDGVVVWERDRLLSDVMDDLEPADPRALLRRVRSLSVVLDSPTGDVRTHVPGLVKLARYLLRTAIYATAMVEGRPCFSVRELAARFEDPKLATLLASDPALLGEPTDAVLEQLLRRLVNFIGPLPHNEFGSLEALVVAKWHEDRTLAAVAIRTMSRDDSPFDYADLPKVVL